MAELVNVPLDPHVMQFDCQTNETVFWDDLNDQKFRDGVSLAVGAVRPIILIL